MEGALFYIPSRTEDLEKEDLLPPGSIIATLMSIDHLGQDGYRQEIETVLSRITSDGAEEVSKQFDMIYTLLKNRKEMNVDNIVAAVEAMTTSMQFVLSLQERLLLSVEDPPAPDYQNTHSMHANAIKILGWFLSKFVIHAEHEIYQKELPSITGRKKKSSKQNKDSKKSIPREKIIKNLVQSINSDMMTEDEKYYGVILHVATVLVENPVYLKNLPGKNISNLRDSIFELVISLGKVFKDVVSSQIADLITAHEHFPKFAALLCKAVGYEEPWSCSFVDEILTSIVDRAMKVSTDSKNIGVFLTELANALPNSVEKNVETLHGALLSEAPAIRKAALNGFSQILICGNKKDNSQTSHDNQSKERLIACFYERMYDINSWVRVCVLNNIKVISQSQGTLTIVEQLKFLEHAVERLIDKNSFVRHSAMQCVSSIVTNNMFSDMLALSAYKVHYHQKLDQIATSEASAIGGQTAEEIEKEIKTFDLSVGLSPEKERLRFIYVGLQFIKTLHEAVAQIIKISKMKTVQDVTESLRLLTTLIRFKVEKATTSMRSIFIQIFNRESSVRDVVKDCFLDIVSGPGIIAGAKSESESLQLVTNQLLRITQKSTEGELSALSKLLSEVGVDFCEQHADCCWNLVEVIREKNLSKEDITQDHRVAMQLFSILCGVCPDVANHHFIDLRNWALPTLCYDNQLAIFICKSLEACGQSKEWIKQSLIEGGSLYDSIGLLLIPEKATGMAINKWVPVARAALSAVYSLCSEPSSFTKIIVDSLFSEYSKRLHAYNAAPKTHHIEEDLLAGMPNLSKEGDAMKRSAQYLLSKMLFILGESSLRELGSAELAYREEIESIHANKEQQDIPTKDVIEEELGMESKGARETAAEDSLNEREKSILLPTSLWGKHSGLVVAVCLQNSELFSDPWLKSCGVLCFSMYMLVTEQFATNNVQYLFSILNFAQEQVIRVNVITAIGDLMTRWPNVMEPWIDTFSRVLLDEEDYVRSTAFLVISHLILNDMLKARRLTHTLLAGLVDKSELIRDRAALFLKEFSTKDRVFTSLPDTVSSLARNATLPEGGARVIIIAMLDYIDKENQTEKLVSKLCLKFSQQQDEELEAARAKEQQKDVSIAIPTQEVPIPPEEQSETQSQNTSDSFKLRHGRLLAEALSLLDIKQTSDRSIKRLVSDACFRYYSPFLSDVVVLSYFMEIAAKVRRHVPGAKENPESKTTIEAWEKRILDYHQKVTGNEAIAEQMKKEFGKKKKKKQDREGSASDSGISSGATKRKPKAKSKKSKVKPADDSSSSDSDSSVTEKRKPKPKSKQVKRRQTSTSNTSSSSGSATDSADSSEPKTPVRRKPRPKAKRGRRRKSTTESSSSAATTTTEESDSDEESNSPKAASKPPPKPRGKRVFRQATSSSGSSSVTSPTSAPPTSVRKKRVVCSL